jgi:hypothetical protein
MLQPKLHLMISGTFAVWLRGVPLAIASVFGRPYPLVIENRVTRVRTLGFLTKKLWVQVGSAPTFGVRIKLNHRSSHSHDFEAD